jgi:phage baseplate assembly protein W
MKAIDYKQVNDDLIIAASDFKKVESDEQHITDILMTRKGSWKRSPITGVGLFDYINAPNTKLINDELHQKIKLQLENDGFDDVKVLMNGIMNFSIDANRK